MYAIVAEAAGRSLPLVFAFVATDGSAAPGAKDRALQDVLRWVKMKCPHVAFTLSDKDMSEINAFAAVFDKAKHQLCYWHAIRYLEERLSENKPPAAYNSRQAHKIHSFIDPTWAPGVTNGHIIEGTFDFTEEDLLEVTPNVLVSRLILFISFICSLMYLHLIGTSTHLTNLPGSGVHPEAW